MATDPPGSPSPPSPEPTDDPIAGIRRVSKMIAAGFTILCVIAIFIFWLGWVRAPQPVEVCAHKTKLVLETSPAEQREGAEALVGKLEVSCIKAAERKIRLRGKVIWARYAKCVTGASSLSDAERC